jgi:hypothetical protein
MSRREIEDRVRDCVNDLMKYGGDPGSKEWADVLRYHKQSTGGKADTRARKEKAAQ